MGQSSTKQTKVTFHPNHGDDIELGDDSVAVRVENRATSWCNGLIFSSEPIKANQKIYLRFVVVSRASHDVISIAFTNNDPQHFRSHEAEPQNAFSLSKHFCSEDTILCFYVSTTGSIHYGKNNPSQFKVLNKKVDVSRPCWAVFHIWSEPTTIRLLTQSEAKQSVFGGRDEGDSRVVDEEVRARVTKDMGAVTDVTHNEDSEICVICCTLKMDVVFVPCGHLCTCLDCGRTIQSKDNLCPICRKSITTIVRVYKS